MQNNPEILGNTIKSARQKANITMEVLAGKIDVTERYLYQIKNENKNPSFDVLYRLIRELNISSEEIFYPEKPSKDSEIEDILRMLSDCDERSLDVVRATAKALIETAPKKQAHGACAFLNHHYIK